MGTRRASGARASRSGRRRSSRRQPTGRRWRTTKCDLRREQRLRRERISQEITKKRRKTGDGRLIGRRAARRQPLYKSAIQTAMAVGGLYLRSRTSRQAACGGQSNGLRSSPFLRFSCKTVLSVPTARSNQRQLTGDDGTPG